MSVVIETTIGDITVDLFLEKRPRTCLNFLKLCKLKYYNFNLFHTIQHDFVAQTGDPVGASSGHTSSSVWGIIEGQHKRYFEAESTPKIRHSEVGLISMVSSGDGMVGSQFFFTLGADLLSLDDSSHCVFGEVVEGLDVLRQLNETICDEQHRPYKDVRITHTVILNDPYENPRGFREPSRSPSPSAERLKGGRIAADEDINDTEGKTEAEVNEMLREQEAKAQATILEIVGDLPDADMAPPENVLFVCKLNPVTSDDDLEIIFSRFGKIKGCEVIRDKQSGESLQYAFVEFEEQKSCEDAYFKMDNVLIDDRRIHVDFSQSVAMVQWKGKGRGGGGPKINFNDKNWKNKKSGGNGGHWGAGQNRPRQNRSRSPMMRKQNRSPIRRDDRYGGNGRGGVERRRSPDVTRRNSPQRRPQNSQVSSRRRSRSRSPRRDRERYVDRERKDRERPDRRYEEDRKSDRPRNNRSRSRSPRRRSSPAHIPRGNRPAEDDRRMSSKIESRDRNYDDRRRPRSRSRDVHSSSRQSSRRDDNKVDREVVKGRNRSRSPVTVKVTSRKRSSSSESSSSSDSEVEKKKKKKKSKKTKKSKLSRNRSDSDSSSSSGDDDDDSEEENRRRKHRKKSSKKSKKHSHKKKDR